MTLRNEPAVRRGGLRGDLRAAVKQTQTTPDVVWFARVKKWGDSLGLVMPADVVHLHNIRDGDYLEVEFCRRVPRLDELSGTWKFRRNLSDLLREMEEGWDDL